MESFLITMSIVVGLVPIVFMLSVVATMALGPVEVSFRAGSLPGARLRLRGGVQLTSGGAVSVSGQLDQNTPETNQENTHLQSPDPSNPPTQT